MRLRTSPGSQSVSGLPGSPWKTWCYQDRGAGDNRKWAWQRKLGYPRKTSKAGWGVYNSLCRQYWTNEVFWTGSSKQHRCSIFQVVVLKCDPCTSSSSHTWKLLRNANSGTSSHLLHPKHWTIRDLRSPLGDCDAGSRLVTHCLPAFWPCCRKE